MIRKMQTAAGGPIHYSRTLTPENLSKAANYVGGYVLKGLGALGKIMTAPLTGGPLGPATVVLPKTKKLLDAERKLRETQELLIGRASTWLSPLNYGAALATGNGLNARKGEEEVASWSPAWLAVGRLGELYVGPKAIKGVKSAPKAVVNTAAKTGVKPAKAAVIAREFNNVLSKAPKTKEFIMPGLVGWAPKTKFKGYHASNENPFIPDFFREGWALKTHNAVKGIYIANGKAPGYGFLTKRKYVHPVETTFENPLIQLGEVKGRTKNGIRNLIERDAQELGADGIIFKGIADNLMLNLFIAKTLNPDTKVINRSIKSDDSKQIVFVQDKYGWKELSYPAYINHVWSLLKAKGIKTEPFDRSNTNQETLMNFFNKGFNPVFKIYPQSNLKAHAQEILRRMRNFGLDVDNTMGELPLYGKKSIRDLVTLNSGRTSYVGYYNKSGVSGTYFHNNGTSIVDPGYPMEDISPLESIATTMHHERNMHGTLKFLTPEMWKLYEDFLNKMISKVDYDPRGFNVAQTPSGRKLAIGKGSHKKEELRATIGEIVKNIYDNHAYHRAVIKNPNVKKYDLETLRPHFEKAVDEMPNERLSYILSNTNGYGADYAEIGPKENPKFFEELRTLLKIAPASLLFLIPRKEEKK